MSTHERRRSERDRRLFTVEEYMRLDDDRRYEVIEGELCEMTPAPNSPHQGTLVALTEIVGRHVREHDLGRVYVAPYDVILGPHDVVQPDLIFVSKARLAILDRANCKGAPDLVVEILSASTRRRDLGKKRELYARAGIPHHWTLDPDAREVVELGLEGGGYVERAKIGAAEGVFAPALFPGLAIEIATLFPAG